MTRPQKGEDDKRKFIVKVRMTASEKIKLFSNASEAGLTPSDYIRKATTGSVPRIKKATPERVALITALAQLGKIGSNLNQIARALNRRSGDSGELTSVNAKIIEYGINEANTLIDHLINLANE